MSSDRNRRPSFDFGADPAPGEALRERGAWRTPVLLGLLVATLAGAGGYLYVERPGWLRTLLADTPLALPPTVTRAYKWQDAAGSWHLTDDPPPQGVVHEVVTVRSDTNVVPAAGRKR